MFKFNANRPSSSQAPTGDIDGFVPSSPVINPSLSRPNLSLEKDIASEIAVVKLGGFFREFTKPDAENDTTCKNRIIRAAKQLDGDAIVNEFKSCKMRFQTTRLFAIAKLSGGKSAGMTLAKMSDEDHAHFKQLLARANSESSDSDGVLSLPDRKQLIQLAAHYALTKTIDGIEFSQFGDERGTDALLEKLESSPSSDVARGEKLAAELTDVFACFETIAKQAELELVEIQKDIREYIPQSLNRPVWLTQGQQTTPEATPESSSPQRASFGRRLLNPLIGVKDYGHQGFRKKALALATVAKPDRDGSNRQEIIGGRNGHKVLKKAFLEGGIVGGTNEFIRQTRVQWGKQLPQTGHHGYSDAYYLAKAHHEQARVATPALDVHAIADPVPDQIAPSPVTTPIANPSLKRDSALPLPSQPQQASASISQERQSSETVPKKTSEVALSHSLLPVLEPLDIPFAKSISSGSSSQDVFYSAQEHFTSESKDLHASAAIQVVPGDIKISSFEKLIADNFEAILSRKKPVPLEPEQLEVSARLAEDYLKLDVPTPVPAAIVKRRTYIVDRNDMSDPENIATLKDAIEVAGPGGDIAAAYKKILADEEELKTLTNDNNQLLYNMSKPVN